MWSTLLYESTMYTIGARVDKLDDAFALQRVCWFCQTLSKEANVYMT